MFLPFFLQIHCTSILNVLIYKVYIYIYIRYIIGKSIPETDSSRNEQEKLILENYIEIYQDLLFVVSY